MVGSGSHKISKKEWKNFNIELSSLFISCVYKTGECVKIGYGCKTCSFLICVQCIGTIIPTLNICLNGHELIWSREAGKCINELEKEVKSQGFVCKQDCLYYICFDCVGFKINSKKCINQHDLKWVRDSSYICAKCLQKESGFICEIDKFFVCDKCLKTNYKNFNQKS